jgi:hypothetical protein
MKRSAQVALVLMGVTGTTATAAYMMPARECRPQQTAPAATPATATPPATNLPPGVTPKQPVDCSRSYRSSYHSWGNWGWNSDRRTSTPTSVSTALTNSGGRVGAVSSTSSSSSSSTSRGGFGSTGHASGGS